MLVMRVSSLLVSLVLAFTAPAPVSAANPEDLLRMTERLDRLDKLDFEQAIDKANACTRARDFDCAENYIRTARKLATSTTSKATLRLTETQLVTEKAAVEEEKRVMAQRQRELEQAQARLEEAERRAQRAEESPGMSTGEKIALFGTLLGQAYQAQSATRMAEAANARRFQQQIDAGKAEVARNQQRFAEERARLEAQRTRLQAQAPQRPTQPAQSQPVPQPFQPQTQMVAQADLQQSQRAQRQRELEASATQRAQIVRQLEADARAQAAATQAESQNRAVQALADAANARTPPAGTAGNRPASASGSAAGSSSQDGRIRLNGTMYVVHYAALKHSRSDSKNITVVEQVTPVEWTYESPRVSPLQQPSGRSNSVPYQVSDLLLKQMRPKFFDYLRGKYSICEGGNTAEGCYGWSVYHQIGNSASEVQAKLNASLGSFSAPVTRDSGLDYPRSVAYSE